MRSCGILNIIIIIIIIMLLLSIGKAHCEMILNNKTPSVLLWDHSQLTFRLIGGSEGQGESRAWMVRWSLKCKIWIITPHSGRLTKQWDKGTPLIINDDKTYYNQVKSTLFHFLTEFKHTGPFFGSQSFRAFWPLASIWAILISWRQIFGWSLPFIVHLHV